MIPIPIQWDSETPGDPRPGSPPRAGPRRISFHFPARGAAHPDIQFPRNVPVDLV